jgi:hypothetical protein
MPPKKIAVDPEKAKSNPPTESLISKKPPVKKKGAPKKKVAMDPE